MNQKSKMSLWIGIAAFAACILWQFAAGLFLPADIGIVGSAVLEVGLIVIAVVPVLLKRIPLKEVFSFKKPSWNHLLAIVVLYYASSQLTSIITYITGYFFPEQMLSTLESILTSSDNIPGWLTFCIIALMAPLCEEPLHRGLIQYSTGRLRSNTWRIILMGIFFGIFHLDPMRFFITGALGALLAYLMLETENLLIPMLFHFLNNAVSAASMLFAPSVSYNSSMFSAFMLGIILLMYGITGPFLLYGGARLLTLKNCISSGKPFPHKKFLIICGCIAAACAVFGIALIITGFSDFFTGFGGII